VICGLSGGVDSAASRGPDQHKADRRAAHVHLRRQRPAAEKRSANARRNQTFRDHFHIDLRVNDAKPRKFLACSPGITEPQEKRKTHRQGNSSSAFKRTAAERNPKLKTAKRATFLAQGTLYPDVIESGHGYRGPSATIKLHHNVGGLPERWIRARRAAARAVQGRGARARPKCSACRVRSSGGTRSPAQGSPCAASATSPKARCDVLRDADAIVLPRSSGRAGLYTEGLWQASRRCFR
jgi:GMP synthase (glutamine-hydrolysing)